MYSFIYLSSIYSGIYLQIWLRHSLIKCLPTWNTFGTCKWLEPTMETDAPKKNELPYVDI